MGRPLEEWHRLLLETRSAVPLGSVERVRDLEKFHDRLISVCGEEPCVAMTLVGLPQDSGDLIEVSLADYLGWFLRSQHAALYRWERGSLRCFAEFGKKHEPELSVESSVVRWALSNGVLNRQGFSLKDLSADESEMLLRELDTLDAHWVAPIVLNEGLWGLVIAGPSFSGTYIGGEELYLTLYGLKVMTLAEGRSNGILSLKERMRREEERVMEQAMEVWAAFRPKGHPVRLLLVEEEPDVLISLSRFFSHSGFEVRCASRQQEAIRWVAEFLPDVVLVDLHVEWSFPKKLLEMIRELTPEAIVFGTTTIRSSLLWEELVRTTGVQEIFKKPTRFAALAKVIFEAGTQVAAVKGSEKSLTVRRCLIIEDEPDTAAATKELLEFSGYRTWIAGTGREGLALAGKVLPQLVLLDLGLPDISGKELLKKLRNVSPHSRVVVTTARFDDYPPESLQSFCPDAYCAKPFPAAELHRVVEQVLVQ